MKPEEFTQAMTFLGIAYNKEFSPEHISVWYEFFKDINIKDFKMAVGRIVNKSKFLPSISELKSEIALISNPVLQMNAEDEWDNVLRTVRRFGSYRETEAMESLNPYTRNIIRQIGYKRICMSESIQWERKEFIELFNVNKDRDENAYLLTEPQMTLAEITRKARIKAVEFESEGQKLLS